MGVIDGLYFIYYVHGFWTGAKFGSPASRYRMKVSIRPCRFLSKNQKLAEGITEKGGD
ncbi:MAG: hypothetical protein WCS73_06300 [Lentisphaeria bacterium]